jgi:dihydropyrimidinase
MLDLAIRGGDVVAPHGTGRWNVGVKDGKIAFVGLEDQAVKASKVIDATGKLVVPGGIEPHTHLGDRITMQPSGAGLFALGPEEDTRGMAFGGTTTHVDFAWVHPRNDVTSAIERRMNRWNNKSHVDYTFHVALTGQLPLKTFDQLPEAIQQGFPSFKVFTADFLPPHPRRFPLRMDLGRIQLAMEKVAAHDGIMVVHAEDHDIVQFNYERFKAEGRTEGWNMHLVHSNLSESLSFRRAIGLAGATGAGIYFVHTSARDGVEAVMEARAKGLPIYAETLHHYACFSAEDYKLLRGFCYHTYPSLKYPDDQKALWDGLVNDGISTTATDEYPTSLELKLRGKEIDDVTGGNLGAEARLGIIYTEGVVKRGMTLQRFAEVTATNAAKILGLYPRKGVIAPGSDADLVLIDPSINKTLGREDFHVSDYSPWEGWEVKGWPVTTILRGKVIVDKGQLFGDLNDGQLVARRIDPRVLRRPAA